MKKTEEVAMKSIKTKNDIITDMVKIITDPKATIQEVQAASLTIREAVDFNEPAGEWWVKRMESSDGENDIFKVCTSASGDEGFFIFSEKLANQIVRDHNPADAAEIRLDFLRLDYCGPNEYKIRLCCNAENLESDVTHTNETKANEAFENVKREIGMMIRDHKRKITKHNLLPSLNNDKAQCPLCGYVDFDTEFMDDSRSVNMRCPSCAEDLEGEWYGYYVNHKSKYAPDDVDALIKRVQRHLEMVGNHHADFERDAEAIIVRLRGSA